MKRRQFVAGTAALLAIPTGTYTVVIHKGQSVGATEMSVGRWAEEYRHMASMPVTVLVHDELDSVERAYGKGSPIALAARRLYA